MASIDNNVGRTHRLRPNLPTQGGTGAPLAEPPSDPKPKANSDERTIVARPQTEQERQQAVLQAAKAAQAAQTGTLPKKDDEPPTAKAIADAVSVADGVREGVRIGSNMDELRNLPVLGKLVQGESRIGSLLTSLARSHVGESVATLLQSNRYIAPVARGLGRIAPFAGAVVAGFDIHGAVKTVNDPKAGGLEKGLAVAKGALSAISGVAGLAALVLAPTGIGAAIAGGIALASGVLSTGVDVWLGHVKDQRKKAEQQPQKQPVAPKP